MSEKKTALFICVHNSARSQMAEEYLRRFGGEEWQVESAGFEPGPINPLVAEVLGEEGIDIRDKKPRDVFELFKQGRAFQYVITVCEESGERRCPVFPGVSHRLHMPFPDPARLTGSHEEKLARVRELRESIKEMVKEFLDWDQAGDDRRLGDYWSLK